MHVWIVLLKENVELVEWKTDEVISYCLKIFILYNRLGQLVEFMFPNADTSGLD